MFEKVFVITRKTRLAELVERFNTVGQARFYIEHAGGNFGEYEREDAVYRSAVEETRRSLPSELSGVSGPDLPEPLLPLGSGAEAD